MNRFRSIAASLVPFVLSGCGALFQDKDEVVIREPGNRFYGPPSSVAPRAEIDWPYAYMSAAVYGRAGNPDATTFEGAPCPPPGSVLDDHMWAEWPFLEPADESTLAPHHLKVAAWKNKELATIVIAFGGTIADDPQSWRANFRWLLPATSDQYSDVSTTVVPAFQKKLSEAYSGLGPDEYPTIIATGHSLGGGLAQDFAYAFNQANTAARVSKVFAFDTSPVTAYTDLKFVSNDTSLNGLEIFRIFERHEILAYVRSMQSWLHPPSQFSPAVTTVRYTLFNNLNPIADHSIQELACRIEAARRPRGPMH